jgi:hypothetical protein
MNARTRRIKRDLGAVWGDWISAAAKSRLFRRSLTLPADNVRMTGTSGARLAAMLKAGHVAVMANHRSSWRAWALLLAANLCLTPGLLLDGAEPGYESSEAIRHAYLGVSVDPVDPAVHRHLSATQGAGLTVRTVAPNSPAARAGLRQHDILLRWEDQWLFTAGQLRALLGTVEPGQTIQLTILRQGNEQQIELELGERPRRAEPGPELRLASVPFAGWQDRAALALHLAEMLEPAPPIAEEPQGTLVYEPERLLEFRWRPADHALLAQLGLGNRSGVIIDTVQAGAPAAQAGLEAGDIVLALDGDSIANPDQFAERLRGYPPAAPITFQVWRGTGPVDIQAKLPQPVTREVEPRLPVAPFHGGGVVEDWIRNVGGAVDWIILLEGYTETRAPSAGIFAAGEPVQPADPFAAVSEFDILDLPGGQGSVEVQERSAGKYYIIRNQQGSILYEGPIDTEADRLALRPLSRELRQAVEDFAMSPPVVAPPIEVKVWRWPVRPADL